MCSPQEAVTGPPPHNGGSMPFPSNHDAAFACALGAAPLSFVEQCGKAVLI